MIEHEPERQAHSHLEAVVSKARPEVLPEVAHREVRKQGAPCFSDTCRSGLNRLPDAGVIGLERKQGKNGILAEIGGKIAQRIREHDPVGDLLRIKPDEGEQRIACALQQTLGLKDVVFRLRPLDLRVHKFQLGCLSDVQACLDSFLEGSCELQGLFPQLHHFDGVKQIGIHLLDLGLEAEDVGLQT